MLNEDDNNSLFIKTIIPVNPTKTPRTCFFNSSSLNTATLIKSVKSGVSETMTAVTELEISVSANANKYAGKNDPINAEIATHFIFSLGIILIFLYPIGAIIRVVTITLKEPN
jgi:hypothetical protein